MNFMLGKIEFHGILEYQRYVFSHGSRICQVFVFTVHFCSISNIVKAHRSLNDLSVVGNNVFNRILEDEILVLFRKILDHLPDQLRSLLVSAILAVILQNFLRKWVALIPADRSLKSILNAFFLKNAVAIIMNPGLTLSTINHVG